MRIVFIHGRSQGGKDLVKLQQTWTDTLKKGYAAASIDYPDDVSIDFPFYGDRMDELIRELDAPLVEDVVTKGAAADSKEAEFRGELLAELAEGARIADDEIQAEFRGDPMEKGPLNWEWVHSILKVLDRTPMGAKTIDLFTRDVYVYLTNAAVRRQIDDLVSGFLPSEPCVVVGHSLGTVVGYNVLRNAPSGTSVSRYITLGSPLGLKAIKKKLATPIAMPTCTKSWYNAMDERDVVALHPLDGTHFPITPTIKNKTNVNNHTDNRHGIVGYLNDSDVARNVHEALSTIG